MVAGLGGAVAAALCRDIMGAAQMAPMGLYVGAGVRNLLRVQVADLAADIGPRCSPMEASGLSACVAGHECRCLSELRCCLPPREAGRAGVAVRSGQADCGSRTVVWGCPMDTRSIPLS